VRFELRFLKHQTPLIAPMEVEILRVTTRRLQQTAGRGNLKRKKCAAKINRSEWL